MGEECFGYQDKVEEDGDQGWVFFSGLDFSQIWSLQSHCSSEMIFMKLQVPDMTDFDIIFRADIK